jgi:hypothetical protein
VSCFNRDGDQQIGYSHDQISMAESILKIQATLVIVLLVVLVALVATSEWRAMNSTPSTMATPVSQPTGPNEFSVTAVADGQYVMRANNKIFYCVNNRCTGIQLINPVQEKPAAAVDEAGDRAAGEVQ